MPCQPLGCDAPKSASFNNGYWVENTQEIEHKGLTAALPIEWTSPTVLKFRRGEFQVSGLLKSVSAFSASPA